jgi:hypothetical protein
MDSVIPDLQLLGALIDQLTETQLRRAELEAQSKELGKRLEYLEGEIIRMMADSKLEKAANGGTTVTPKQHTYPHPEDWGKFSEFIYENRYLHLLEKRISVTGYRELLNLGREVPGVVPFVKTKLSVHKTLR